MKKEIFYLIGAVVGALLVLFEGWRRRPRPQAKD